MARKFDDCQYCTNRFRHFVCDECDYGEMYEDDESMALHLDDDQDEPRDDADDFDE